MTVTTISYAAYEAAQWEAFHWREQNPSRATQTYPLYSLLLPGEPCFVDIEFQNYLVDGRGPQKHRVGRIAILNTRGDVVLDAYAVYNNEDNVKKCFGPIYWQEMFGVTKRDLIVGNGAIWASNVERWAANIFKDRIVVMHGGKHDRSAFYLTPNFFDTSTIVDTQKLYYYEQSNGTPGLKTLAARILGRGHPYDRAAAQAKLDAEKATDARKAARSLKKPTGSQKKKAARAKKMAGTAQATKA
ncbi:hypothetical protein LTR78_000092 [Recurvomyces mirabilis]|uniref:Uncharacterized protein n=1 Tax=Recurvomyces mirabilis TaxID=574656 RepID=A0AAE1C699_9PEZI|nr:hypothetical protein LTR78_000092 [Recurvomyces mirabilis]KAK5161749.1 hypothetical protein LTS14_000094 [Recurvomyces mirabilis]